MKKINSQWSIVNGRWLTALVQWIAIVLILTISSCSMPKEKIELRQIKDVIADATSEPMLKAKAIFYNPNDTRARLKKIDVEIFVNGKKVGKVDQDLKLIIPAKDEFSVDLEVKLALKELGFMDTLFGMLGGKKFQIEYKGFLKLTYHGFPIRVPVNYKDEIRVKF
jgi:LEA14-like dessication related protein